jgi:hypothetical protein
MDEALLLFAARSATSEDLAETLASQFRIRPEIGASILADDSAHALAILCRGAPIARATFSALAVLARPGAAGDDHYRRLAIYDSVPAQGARALLAFWREQVEPGLPVVEAA